LRDTRHFSVNSRKVQALKTSGRTSFSCDLVRLI
jgi:hypothetical protein